jgi:outer membrane protein
MKHMKKDKGNRGADRPFKAVIIVVNVILASAVIWLYVGSRPKIAYVQSSYLLSNYQGFKDASLAYQQKSSLWQSNIDTLAKELTSIKTKYQQDLSKLTAKEKELSIELIKAKDQQLQQYQQGIQQKAAQEDQTMTSGVVQEVNAFLKEYGEARNYMIIFGATDMGNVVYAREGLDITEEVLEALNKNYRGE